MPAFLSYARKDNERAENKILEFATLLEEEIQQRSGDSKFRIYVDREQHEWGVNWRNCIDEGIDEAVVFIAVISPTYFQRPECINEFEQFVNKQNRVLKSEGWDPRNRLILPVLYRQIPDRLQTLRLYSECALGQIENLEEHIILGESIRCRKFDEFRKRLASRIIRLHTLLDALQGACDRNDLEANRILLLRLQVLSRGFTEISHKLPNGRSIDRSEITQILDELDRQEYSEQYVLGDPGIGKSTVLREVAARWIAAGNIALVIKADLLPIEINSLAKLSEWVLGRNGDIVGELERLVGEYQVAVIIDQLDSLANLVDLESGRLNAVLDLVNALRNQKLIPIVAASRLVELHSDIRLGSLLEPRDVKYSVKRIDLSLLDKASVVAELAAIQIDAADWPPSSVEFLQTPYHLAAYIGSISGPSSETVPPMSNSLRSLHAIRWKLLQSGPDAAVAISLLQSLAQQIASREESWHLATQLTLDTTVVERLREAKWLRQSEDGKISFDHQTQYEFVIGKLWAKDVPQFVRHVVERQHGLSIRPILWRTLNYLRDDDYAAYVAAMSQLLAQISRRHLQRLLLEFVTTVKYPEPKEIEWMLGWLDHSQTHPIACYRLRNNPAWIAVIPDEVILRSLRNFDQFWPMACVVQAAFGVDRDRAHRLLLEAWAYRRGFRDQLWDVVTSIDRPDNEFVAWLLWLVVTTEVSEHKISMLEYRWKQSLPCGAIELMSAWLQKQIKPLSLNAANETGDRGIELGDSCSLRQNGDTSSLSKFLSEQFWTECIELAELEPRHFLGCIWPWILTVCEVYPALSASRLKAYRSEADSHFWLRSDDGVFPGANIIRATMRALDRIAKLDPSYVRTFVIQHLAIDSMTVQAILAYAVQLIAKQYPDLSLAVLRDDSRRLSIHLFSSETIGTVSLVRSALAYWTKEQLSEFQRIVLNWNPYRDEGEPEFILECQTDLLSLVPKPNRTPDTHAAIGKQEEIMRKREAEWELRMNTHIVVEDEFKLPTVDELCQMAPEAAIDVIDRSLARESMAGAAQTDFRHGSIHRLLRDFTSKEHSGALAVIRKLSPDRHSDIAGTLLGAIDWPLSSKTLPSFSLDTVHDVVLELMGRNFEGRSFHDGIGRTVHRLAVYGVPISFKIAEELARWLQTDNLPAPTEDSDNTRNAVDHIDTAWANDGHVGPILWGMSSGDFIPHEFYWVGEALKAAEYSPLEGETPLSWVSILKTCIERPFNERLWRCWLFAALQYVPDREAFATFLLQLLDRLPNLLSSREALSTIRAFSPWFNPNEQQRIVTHLRASKLCSLQQAAGELAALFAIRDFNEVEEIAESYQRLGVQICEPFITGLVHTAGSLLHVADFRDRSVDILVAVCPSTLPRVVKAFNIAFRHKDALVDDECTLRLLTAINDYLPFDKLTDPYQFVSLLWPLVDTHPKLVLSISGKIVKHALASSAHRIHMCEEKLVRIATTLHRNALFREPALTLFEDLQQLEATAVQSFLDELDHKSGRVDSD